MASRPISPAEPTKKHPPHIQPNAHPYAIKTTSSALLSRSNSSPYSAHYTRHHYVPSSRVQTETRARHCYSSSLPSLEAEVQDDVRGIPMPLPTPPSVAVAFPDDSSVPMERSDRPRLTHRVRRAETMPSSSGAAGIPGHHSYDQIHRHCHNQSSGVELCAGLPPNPKQWNTDELITYLEMSLRSCDNSEGDKDDSLVDILECIRTCGLTGRELLRLTDADLVGTPLSDVQRAQLLDRSRVLRADVLRGRIYAHSYHSHEISDDSNVIYSRSTSSSTMFPSIRGASISVDDLRLLPDDNIGVCEGLFPSSPAMFLHCSSSSSDVSAKRYRDLAHMRMRRRGKVKGLVETWERVSTSGSECSAGEEGSESETDPKLDSISDAKLSPESASGLLSSVHAESPHDIHSSIAGSKVVLQEPSLLTPPPPYTHIFTESEVIGNEGEEPTIEELLASSSDIPLSGARAWEADFGLGETVKRIPVPTRADADSASSSVVEPGTSHAKNDGSQTQRDSVRCKGSGKNAKTQKRVITAIFTASPSDDVSENVGDDMISSDSYCLTGNGSDTVRDTAPARSDLQDDSDGPLRALEASFAATCAQVEAFRLRLEAVEAETARREAKLEEAQCSGPSSSSQLELRRRRSEANEQARPNIAEQFGDETVTKSLGNGGAPRSSETMSMGDIARAIVARAMGWMFPYEHIGALARRNQDQSQACASSHHGVNDRYSTPVRGNRHLSVARMSCSIFLFSFALCAAVLRRIGLGRWVRRP